MTRIHLNHDLRIRNERDSSCQINSWQQFAREVRSKGKDLLCKLDSFPNSILITGCQRSGTTMLSRVITGSDGMVDYRFGQDDELDAALILSGHVNQELHGRYCFQTTYLNECYHEYLKYSDGHKIIWVIRNPLSVVYSLLHNWRRFAFNELFRSCGVGFLEWKESRRYDLIGRWGLSRLERACLSYNGKVSQVFELVDRIDKDRLIIIDYDELVKRKDEILPAIYQFIDLEYKTEYVDFIHNRSVSKAKNFSVSKRTFIENKSMHIYKKARELSSFL